MNATTAFDMMSCKRQILFGILTIAVLVLLFSILKRKERELGQQYSKLASVVYQLETRMSEEKNRRNALDAELAALKSKKEPTLAPVSPEVPKEEKRTQSINILSADLFSNPEYVKIAKPFIYGLVMDRYGPLFCRLNLNDEAKEHLKDKFADRIIAGYDINLAMQSLGINPLTAPGGADHAKILNDCDASLYNEIEKTFGIEVRNDVTSYIQNLSVKNLAEAMITRLSDSNIDSGAPDIESLQRLLSTEPKAVTVPPFLLTTDVPDKIPDSVANLLTPQQKRVLDELLEEKQVGRNKALLSKKLRENK